jgi:hypothetical protein
MLPIPHYADRDMLDHERAWLAHVEAGRIGQRAEASAERLARHIANERAVLGEVRSFDVKRGGGGNGPPRCG